MDRILESPVNRSRARVLGPTLLLALSTPAMAQNTFVFQNVQNFKNFTGQYPTTPPIQGPDLTLYGTCAFGGSFTWGCVYAAHPDGTLSDLFDFDSTVAGGRPYGGLMMASDGALYGATNSGGSAGFGTIYKLGTDGSGFTVLANLDGTNTGRNPFGPLIQGNDGALYGTTWSGGYYGYGTVFKVDTDGNNLEVINSFDLTNTGGYPAGGLVQATDGAFYGVTTSGGTSGGTVFKVYLKTVHGKTFWACDVIANFDDFTTGSAAYSTLLEASDGMLYGLTSSGGGSGGGTVFKLNKDGSSFSSIGDFNFSSGENPNSVFPLVERSDGYLYGVAPQGGNYPSYDGTAFRIDKSGYNFTILEYFEFYTSSGARPQGLTEGYDHNLYGATYDGDVSQSPYGGVFRLANAAAWANYWYGLAGTYGIPSFVSSAPPVLGTKVTLTIEDSLGQNTNALLVAGTSQALIPYKGGLLLVGQFLAFVPLALTPRFFNLDLTIPSDPMLSGFQLDLQTLEIDPGAVHGVSLTPGLELSLGY